jgi:hypothetical protein
MGVGYRDKGQLRNKAKDGLTYKEIMNSRIPGINYESSEEMETSHSSSSRFDFNTRWMKEEN